MCVCVNGDQGVCVCECVCVCVSVSVCVCSTCSMTIGGNESEVVSMFSNRSRTAEGENQKTRWHCVRVRGNVSHMVSEERLHLAGQSQISVTAEKGDNIGCDLLLVS